MGSSGGSGSPAGAPRCPRGWRAPHAAPRSCAVPRVGQPLAGSPAPVVVAGRGVIPVPAAPTVPTGEQPALWELRGELCPCCTQALSQLLLEAEGGQGKDWKKEKRAVKSLWKVPPVPDSSVL